MSAAPHDTIDDALRVTDAADAIELASAKADVLAAVLDGAPHVVRVGRYVVLERIGSGACSVVYGAYDPELHRRVALKVLRPQRRRGPHATEIVLREARAIASLSHPNVVAVHDVGQGLDGGVFFVMELVEGETLEAWLAAAPRSWTQVVDAMIPIGRGLQAAHARGLVHRDIKPSNVLLGRDGRPRLADFGLVAIAADDPFAGNAVGTPVTMAPEQHLGRVADARCDQYGFAATLHIALHGRPPFGARSALGLLREKLTCAPVRGAGDVPSWLLDVVERGLAADPAQRFADIGAMLNALERGRRRRHRRARAALLAVPLLCAAALGMVSPETPRAQRCRAEGETAVAALWSDETRAAVRAGLRASATAVDSTIDAHLGAWRSARAAACEGETTAAVAQVACLDDRLTETAELVHLLGGTDPDVARAALDAARSLTPIGACERPSADDAELDELDLLLRRARLHESVGRHASAATLVEQALADPRIAEDPTAAARAHAITCRIAIYAADRTTAERNCDEALLAAERAGHTQLAIAGMIRLAEVSDPDAAERLLRLAEARLASQRDAPPSTRANLGLALVRLRERQQRLQDSVVEARRALVFAESAFDPDAPEIVAAINAVAASEARTGSLASAEAAYRRALALAIRVRGHDDPDVGGLLNNLGGVELELGRPDDALATLVRALEVKLAVAGADSPRMVNTLLRIARAWSALGEHDTARAIARRGHALAGGDRSDPLRLHAELELAAIEHAAGDCPGALDTLARAEPGLAHATDDDRGQARWLRGDCRAALADLDEGVAALERFYGTDARDLLPALLASARHAEPERARRLLARARAIVLHTEGDPRHARDVELAWARL